MKPFSKWDAEILLNETKKDELPPEMLAILEARWAKRGIGYKKNTPGKKYGEIIREYHRDVFDAWFNRTYR